MRSALPPLYRTAAELNYAARAARRRRRILQSRDSILKVGFRP